MDSGLGPMTSLFAYVLRHGDDNLVLAQRLSEWISRAPELEEDIALGNIALDHLGVARHLLTYAGEVEGKGRTEDDLAYLRSDREFTNVLLVEQPNGDFAHTMARQLLVDVYQSLLWNRLTASTDATIAGVAAKAEKEARYHLRHSSAWVIRLGDGTEESHRRMQAGLETMWRFTGELFDTDDVDRGAAATGAGIDPSSLHAEWIQWIDDILRTATLERPDDTMPRRGGRSGLHSEHFGYILAEMQWLQRSHPGASW